MVMTIFPIITIILISNTRSISHSHIHHPLAFPPPTMKASTILALAPFLALALAAPNPAGSSNNKFHLRRAPGGNDDYDNGNDYGYGCYDTCAAAVRGPDYPDPKAKGYVSPAQRRRDCETAVLPAHTVVPATQTR
jgi:hypothetical protein